MSYFPVEHQSLRILVPKVVHLSLLLWWSCFIFSVLCCWCCYVWQVSASLHWYGSDMLAVYPSGTINKFHIPFSFNAPSRGYRTTTFGHLISSCSVFSESRVPWSNVECYHSSFSPPGQVKGIGWLVIFLSLCYSFI